MVRRGRVRVALGVVLLGLAPRLAAQELAPGGLTLQQVVDTTLAGNADIRLAVEQLKQGQGALLGARASYDWLLAADMSQERAEEMLAVESGFPGVAATTQRAGYGLSLSRRWRSGLLVRSEVASRQTEIDGLGQLPLSTTSVAFDIEVPLLRDRWGKVGRTAEEAEELGVSADRLSLRHQQALSIFNATAAYWSYLAAQQQLEVFASAESRAARLVEETRQLVEARERPAADLNQVLGNAATTRIDRIEAEQRLVEARLQLGIAMSVPAHEIPRLGPAITGFPQPQPFAADTSVEDLIEAALGRRSDLRAAEQDQAAAHLRLEGAESALQPALDVVLSSGYTGLDGEAGLGGLFDSFHRNVPGPTASVALSYRLPVHNAAARGQMLQAESAYRRQQIARDDLERRIRASVAVTARDVMRSALGAQEAQRAVELLSETVENEKVKHRLGLATLFDVIFAEDRLTGARLAAVGTRLDYALAVARLRFETATLLEGAGEGVTASAELLMTTPDL